MRRALAGILACGGLLAAGCMPPRPAASPDGIPPREWIRSPETTFEFFRECLRLGQYRFAYEVLSEETRRETPEDEFVAQFRNSPDAYGAAAFSRTERVEAGDGPGERILTIRHRPTGVRHRIRLKREGEIWTLVEPQARYREFVREIVRRVRDRTHQ